MTGTLKDELISVKSRIDTLLKEDPFPERVHPEELKEAVRSYPMRGGKRLRPALVLWACAAAGGDTEKALFAAAAVEVFHNWTLVHDDIIDRDEFRRGVPTCHVTLRDYAERELSAAPDRAGKYGNDLAILAGDIQQAWASDLMLRTAEKGVDPALVVGLARRMHNVLNPDLVSGEAMDVKFEYLKNLPSPAEVNAMIAGKTCALLAFSAYAGGSIGSGEAGKTAKLLGEFAFHLGTAFQIQDDLLGIYGDEKTFGKPIGSDFREGKPTLLYVDAMHSLSSADRERLASFRGREDLSGKDIEEIRSLLDFCGAHDRNCKAASAAEQSALKALKAVGDNPWTALLRELTLSLTNRKV